MSPRFPPINDVPDTAPKPRGLRWPGPPRAEVAILAVMVMLYAMV